MENNNINLTKETGQDNQAENKQEGKVEAVIPEEVHTDPAPVSSATPTEPTGDQATKKNKKIGTIAIAAVAAVVLIAGGSMVSSSAYKTPIKNYFEAMEKGNGKKLQKAYGKALVSAMDDYFEDEDFYEYGEYDDIDEMFDEMAESFKDDLEDEYGKKTKITYEITDKDKIDKDDLEDFEDTFKDAFDKKLKISKGYEVDVKAKFKGKDDKDTEKLQLIVLKINGKWAAMGDYDLMQLSYSGFY